eukprot:TRINITY_DN67677_c0_g1_i1.p1 TRINITY_DN67677_c0_g1~~TRINITY_DN67677_c0_g1_i1.p1  ORF type:complete len:421 (-),score=43.16 TRINITY_DN67677_c0_g1_i1:34-1137(-)
MDHAGMGAVFVYRGIGSMTGGFIIGFVLDAVSNPHSILVVLLVVKGAVEFSMPFSSSIVILSLQFAAVAFCGNAITTVASTSISWTYGKLIGVQMNVLNGCFGIGASLAPGLAALARKSVSRGVLSYWAICSVDVFLIVAAIAIPAAKNPRFVAKLNAMTHDQGDACEERDSKQYVNLDEDSLAVDWLTVGLCGGSILFAGACEGAISFWLFTYATHQLGLSDDAAGTVNSFFFVIFTATRFLCCWLVTLVEAASILKGFLVLAVVASFGIVYPQDGAVLPCIGMIGVGIGVAPVAGNAVTALRQKTYISGRAQGSMRIMAACGSMIGGSGTGFLQKTPLGGDGALPTIVFLGLVAEVIVTLAMLRR